MVLLAATACEGEKVCLYCRTGLKLKINDVRYGRDNAYTCYATPAYSARCMKTVTNYVKPKCDGKDMCSFSVSNTELGSDPCPNVYKYVVINYECVGTVTTQGPPSAVRTRVACEFQQLSMECPAGQRVDIVRAVYGRGDSSTCRQGYFYSTSCGSDAKTALANICRGRQSCSVTATNALTGVDPCPGTYKYLIVEFRCL
ncbi:hypothetical protein NP493_229g01034 [Ridgeia piscesae]|uniref:SUEL-type lectin domain-containing protein n=1 Tax=Ridgeia piscesae TaxID=27915 RepID=A0AAD9P023_RIDPI|nr:hypothetical protein NP493_229g01034 [Ridgeia piscesae]